MQIQGHRIAFTAYFLIITVSVYCGKCEKYSETQRCEKYVFLPPRESLC